MDREGFRNRLKQYKLARKTNPGLTYWDFIRNNTDKDGNAVSTKESPIYTEEHINELKRRAHANNVVNYVEAKIRKFDQERDITDQKGVIPFIPEKAITLTNAGKDTGVTLSTNLLDSVAKYAKIADLPLSSALGLAGQESTFGKGYGVEAKEMLPSILVSDWNYNNGPLGLTDRSENPYMGLKNAANIKVYDLGNYILNGNNELEFVYNQKYIDALEGGIRFADKEAKRLGTDIPVLEHAFKKYKSGKYNPNDPRHTQMVEDRGKALMNSPEIQKWMKESEFVPKHVGGGVVREDDNNSGVVAPFTTDGANWKKRPTKEMIDAFYSGDIQRQIQLAEQAGLKITYTGPQYSLDEVVVTAKDPNKYTELDLAKDVANFTPVIGDAMDIYDLGKSVYNGNYAQAAMLGAGLLLPNWLEKGGKFLLKKSKNFLNGISRTRQTLDTTPTFLNIPSAHVTSDYPKDKHMLAIKHLIGDDKSYNVFTEDGSHLLYTLVDNDNFDVATARDFYLKDVIPRMKRTYERALATSEQLVDKLLYPQITEINPFDNQIVIRSNAFEFDDYVGEHIRDNGTTFIRLNDLFLLEGLPTINTLIHETEHALRELIDELLNKSKSPFLVKYPKSKQFSFNSSEQSIPDIGFGPYLHNEKNALDQAYRFTDNFLNKHAIRPLHEKGATNRELRAMLSLNRDSGPIYDLDLDKYIDDLPNDLLLQNMVGVNAYMNSFINLIAKNFGINNKNYSDVSDYLKAISGNPGFDDAMNRVKIALKTSYAEGGEVTDPQAEVLPKEQWPSPEEMYERTKLPFNDLPLENVFSPWDIALGTAYKAWPMVNNVFKNYGPTLGALMVGSDGTNVNKPLQQMLTKKLDPDVKEFYNDIVLPLNPNDKKYKQYFINLFGDIDIQIDPASNMPVNFAADFNPITNDIRLNANYIQTPIQQLLEAHEYGHLVDKYLPHKASTQQELNQSLPVSKKPISKDSDTYRERQSTKREAEFKTFKKLKDAGKLQLKTARAKTKKYQEYLMNATDEEILELLGADTAYKKDYLAGNLDIDTLRKQMIYAPTIAAGIIIPTHLLDSDKKENA